MRLKCLRRKLSVSNASTVRCKSSRGFPCKCDFSRRTNSSQGYGWIHTLSWSRTNPAPRSICLRTGRNFLRSSRTSNAMTLHFPSHRKGTGMLYVLVSISNTTSWPFSVSSISWKPFRTTIRASPFLVSRMRAWLERTLRRFLLCALPASCEKIPRALGATNAVAIVPVA